MDDYTCAESRKTKIEWQKLGEKPSAYFLKLENASAQTKFISNLMIDGKMTDKQEKIEDEIRKFYAILFSGHKTSIVRDLPTFLGQATGPKLSEMSKITADAPFSMRDLTNALKKTPNGTSPGCSGLTYSFYKVFWNLMGNLLFKLHMECLNERRLSPTMSLRLISLLPKGDKPREHIANWRPITLLDTAYKLLSKMIAARIGDALPEIISNDQNGFV